MLAFGPRLRRLTALTGDATRLPFASKRSTAKSAPLTPQISCQKISLRHLYADPDRHPHPIVVSLMTVVVGALFLRETKDIDIATGSGVEISHRV